MERKCSACGSINLEKGAINEPMFAMPPISFISNEDNKNLFNSRHTPLEAYACDDCGCVSLYMKKEKEEKKETKEDIKKEEKNN